MEAKDSVWLKDYSKATPRIKFLRFCHRVDGFLFTLKVQIQRWFSKDNMAPSDIWNLDHRMAVSIYRNLLRYKKLERHGYPSFFSEYNENEWKSKEEYLEAAKNGKIDAAVSTGKISGPEKWELTLDEMIFAFEWISKIDGRLDDKVAQEFYDRWGLKNPYSKTEENKSISYVYEMSGTYIKEQEEGDELIKKFGGLSSECLSNESDLHIKNPEKYKLLGEKVNYYNITYEVEVIETRVQAGIDSFAKHFRSLWD